MCYTPSNPPVESIPALIKSKRKERGLTQRALGEMCGYTGASAERAVSLHRAKSSPQVGSTRGFRQGYGRKRVSAGRSPRGGWIEKYHTLLPMSYTHSRSPCGERGLKLTSAPHQASFSASSTF